MERTVLESYYDPISGPISDPISDDSDQMQGDPISDSEYRISAKPDNSKIRYRPIIGVLDHESRYCVF